MTEITKKYFKNINVLVRVASLHQDADIIMWLAQRTPGHEPELLQKANALRMEAFGLLSTLKTQHNEVNNDFDE